MQTECSPTLFEFEPVERHKVVAGFDGGIITSDAGGLLLGRLDRGLGLIRRMASCFTDRRDPRLLEHTVETLVGQRVFALALGYEDLNDHDELRHDPLFHVLAGKLEAKRSDCAPVAGKSTLNRLEHRPRREAGKYHKIDYDAPSLEALFVDIFLDGHKRAPKEIVLDLDATDDTIHGEQEVLVLPWLLRQLLLPAALHLLRPVPARRQAAPRQHRRGRRRGRRGRPDRRPHPGPLAEGADRAARRFGLLPRGADGVVRGRGCRLPVRPGAQRAPEGGAGARGLGGSAVVPKPPARRLGCSGISPTRQRPPGADRGGLWARPSTCPTVPIRVSW